MSGQSEEKNLPASHKKLRDARKKGQVARSRDLPTALATIAALGYIWITWPKITESLQVLIALPTASFTHPFSEVAPEIAAAAFERAGSILLPLFGLATAISVFASMAVTSGPVFSMEPLVPKPNHISPTEGFKKLFSLKNLMELIKSFIKAVVVTLVLWSVLRHDVGMLLKSSACGIGCIQPVLGRVLFPIVTSVAALFLLSGLLDIGLQRFLFARDMKMSHTEMKRERKEEDGDPVIKRAMHRVRHEVMHGPKVGVKQANMMFVDGSRIVVGMRFVRGETPAPLVVCKGRDDQAIALVQAARRQGAAVLDNAELARALGERVPIGRYIPKDLFPAVAKEMTQAKIV